MAIITLNIGLVTNTGEPLTFRRALQAVFERTADGAELVANHVAQSETEPTAVIAINGELTAHDANRIAQALEQDCIAVSTDNGKTGSLVGPGSHKWGWGFDPAQFIPAELVDLNATN